MEGNGQNGIRGGVNIVTETEKVVDRKEEMFIALAGKTEFSINELKTKLMRCGRRELAAE